MMIPLQHLTVDRTGHVRDSMRGHAVEPRSALVPQQACSSDEFLCHCQQSDACCRRGQFCDCSIGALAHCV